MVYCPMPEYTKKAWLNGARHFVFSPREKRANQVALHATCTRCVQNIASQERRCRKPEHTQCDHCAAGNQGRCCLVPKELNSRMNRVYGLQTAHNNTIANAANARTDPTVKRSGIKLARAQRGMNLALASFKRIAAHTGTPVGVPTLVPTTTPDYLSLVLVEQRRLAVAIEEIAGHLATLVERHAPTADNDFKSQDRDVDTADSGEDDGEDGGEGGAE
ncbi:hypothetical protein IQ07DRAFT_379335 [Pyrenochaeta sp. DS3sAY3a]|nr:hypothetical protein IQ07DRAFT_379335 [Pyrenochaeta sp. DS3sAY3a]